MSLLIDKTHKELHNLAFEVINSIYKRKFHLNYLLNKNKLKWSNKLYTKKDLDKLFEIDVKIKKKIFLRKILAVNYKSYKPYIILHNKKFIME